MLGVDRLIDWGGWMDGRDMSRAGYGYVTFVLGGEKDHGLMPYGMPDLAVDAGTCIPRPR